MLRRSGGFFAIGSLTTLLPTPLAFWSFRHVEDELRDGLVERVQRAESELLGGARCASILVHHKARLVTGAVLNPGLGPPGRERDGDEGGSEVVGPELAAVHTRVVQLIPLDACGLQVTALTVPVHPGDVLSTWSVGVGLCAGIGFGVLLVGTRLLQVPSMLSSEAVSLLTLMHRAFVHLLLLCILPFMLCLGLKPRLFLGAFRLFVLADIRLVSGLLGGRGKRFGRVLARL